MIHNARALVFLLSGLLATGPARADDILVFAAASLNDSLREVAEIWEEDSGNRAVLSLAGSSVLARQIQAGAPADLFLSANPGWMDVLDADGLIDTASRVNLLTNRLVIVAPDPTPLAPQDLPERLGDDRLAMALVDAVPAGIYGKAALRTLGLWEQLAPQVAQTDNARTTLALVARAEVPFGVVYETDALAEPAVHIVATLPDGSHPPIRYPVALISQSESQAARAFLDFLSTQRAHHVFERHGFGLAQPEP